MTDVTDQHHKVLVRHANTLLVRPLLSRARPHTSTALAVLRDILEQKKAFAVGISPPSAFTVERIIHIT
jgi:hypothetical protein